MLKILIVEDEALLAETLKRLIEINPEFRVTASQLSALINGFATILLFAFIDPQLSVMTDDAVEGKVDEADFRRAITFISLSRLAGTILAQALLLPAAMLIAWVAVHV